MKYFFNLWISKEGAEAGEIDIRQRVDDKVGPRDGQLDEADFFPIDIETIGFQIHRDDSFTLQAGKTFIPCTLGIYILIHRDRHENPCI